MEQPHFGPYRIVALLGEGGMGRAYRAVHEDLQREVALKLLHPRMLESREARGRFHREMRLAATLSHPAVVKVYDGGVLDGVDFISMELVEGDTIDRAVADHKPAAWPFALAVGVRIAEALAYLHGHGILHRDVKHNNVKLTPAGEVKLLDFGLAVAMDSTRLTGQDEWVGTYRYIAPEVLTGEPASPASDLWSVGVMLHELIAGQSFLGECSMRDFIQHLIHGELGPPETSPPVPQDVSKLVMRILERDVSRRPASAKDLAEEMASLVRALTGSDVDRALLRGPAPAAWTAARPRSRPEQRSDNLKRIKKAQQNTFRAGVAGAVLGGLAMVALLLPRGNEPRVVALPAATPSPSASAAGPLPFTARWNDVEPWIGRLKGDPKAAARTANDLRRRTGIDLGFTAEPWLRWMVIGRWLEEPGSAPPPAMPDLGAQVPESTEDTVSMALVSLKDRIPNRADEASDTIATVALRMVTNRPSDGRGWLLLGRELDFEGRAGPARKAYAAGIARLDAAAMNHQPEMLWAGLGRALALAPRGDPGQDWLAWISKTSNPNKPWRGLRAGIERSDPALYERILMAGTTDPRHRETAYHYLGKHELVYRRDPAKAIGAFVEGARKLPSSGDLLDLVVGFHLKRGDLAAAAEWLTTPEARARWQHVLAQLRSDEREKAPCDSREASGGWREMMVWASGFLERGCLHEAEETMMRVLLYETEEREEQLPVLLALIGAGSQATWPLEESRGVLVKHRPHLGPWDIAAGELASRQGQPAMRTLLAESARNHPDRWQRDLAQALWQGRSGRYAESLDTLAKLRPQLDYEEAAVEVAEVLSRPVWADALGDADARTVLARALADAGPPIGPAAAYWRKVREGDLSAAATIARDEWLVEPDRPLWALATYAFASLPSCPADFRAWRNRVRFAVRSGTLPPWLLRETREIDRKLSKR